MGVVFSGVIMRRCSRESVNRRILPMLSRRLETSCGTEWEEPIVYDIENTNDYNRLDDELIHGRIGRVYNGIETIANDLFDLRYPSLIDNDDARREFVESDKFRDNLYGRWVMFPWSGDLVRYPEPDDYHDIRTYRYRNLITKAEQDKLRVARVALFGMSVGGNIAINLARNGIGEEIIIGDMARPKVSGIGRSEVDMRDVVNSKIDAVAKRISYIDPFLKQTHFSSGLNEETLELIKDQNVSILGDEVDDMRSSALMRKFAKGESLPYVTVSDVHDRAVLEVVRHDMSDSLPLYVGGVKDDAAEDLIDNKLADNKRDDVFARSVGYRNLTPRIIESSLEIGRTVAGIPQLGSTALGAAGVAVAAYRDIILGRDLKTGIYVAPISRASKSTKVSDWVGAASKYYKHTR